MYAPSYSCHFKVIEYMKKISTTIVVFYEIFLIIALTIYHLILLISLCVCIIDNT